MKQKIIIRSFLLSFICSQCLAQSKIDTTGYFLNLTNNPHYTSIKYCVNQLHNWKAKQGKYENTLILAYFTFKSNEEFCIQLTISYNGLKLDKHIPDYYSYIDGKPVFWFTGIRHLIPQNSEYKSFIYNRFSKYYILKETDEISKYFDAHPNLKDKEVPLSAIFPDGISTGIQPKSFTFPSYLIKVNGLNEDLTYMESDICY